jgi:hypothetical protein
MKALGFWLLVVRLAIVVACVSQCSKGGSHAAVEVKASCVSACDHESHSQQLWGALLPGDNTTEGLNGTSDHWNDSAWRPSKGLDQRVHGHRAGARALPLWVRPIPDHAREAEGGRLTAGRALVRRATHRAGRQARARDAGAAERWTPAPRTERSLLETSKFAERSQRAQDIGALVLMRGDTTALPPALSCGGARARDIQAIMRARARDVGRPVVRLTGGFTSVAQLEERLIPNQQVPGSTPGGRARSGRHEKSTRLGAGNFTDEPCDVGQSLPGTPEQSGDQAPLASGSDLCSLVAEQSVHLSAARARHRGNSDAGVGELAPSVIVSARVGLVAFEQRRPARTLQGRAAVARLAHNQKVGGSIPSPATGLCGLSLDASPPIRYINDRSAMLRQSFAPEPGNKWPTSCQNEAQPKGQAGIPDLTSSIGKNLAIIAWRRPTVTLDTPREGAKPSCSATPKNSERAQQQESAGRPASEDACASGSEAGQSAAEQPASSRGAA